MKSYIFKRTAAQTAKANNAQKIDSRNIIDYSYIAEQINNIDLSEVENLHFSNAAIIERLADALTQRKTIEFFIVGGFLYLTLKIDRFTVVIESTITHYCIYDNESGRQLYKLHAADNLRISIYHEARDLPIIAKTYNQPAFLQMSRYIERGLTPA